MAANSQCYHLRMNGAACGGYVLAGGRSSRMGTDKALLTLGGTTLLERSAAAVRNAVGSVVVVGDPRRYGRFGFPVIEDLYPGTGPLGGIHAALQHAAKEWSLVVACDMPGLDAVWLRRLVEETAGRADADAMLPESGGRQQPLCAVYRRSCLPAFQGALEGGRYKMLDALAGLRVVRIEMGEEARFRNVNTPEDWGDIQQALRALGLEHAESGR
jgi:molybdopterin-guanine dinucleotide biosynthesis protein A